jgi:predicted Fe-Mo cluster-binding NifX family protein
VGIDGNGIGKKGKSMKVCIPSYGPTLDSRVQPIFARCDYFIFVDPESMVYEAESNPFASVSGEAGPESAQMVINKGAKTVLTAQVGVKARQALEASGVEVVGPKGETVREAAEAFRKGHAP